MLDGDSRRYVRRVWRIPKHRGALEAFGSLVLKALRKHGWPARLVIDADADTFFIHHVDGRQTLPPDFEDAVGIAVRIAARTYSVDVHRWQNMCVLAHKYVVTARGDFRRAKEGET